MNTLEIVISLAALAVAIIAFLSIKRTSSELLREINHSDDLMPNEEVPGTDWVYCSGDCSVVNRPNNNLKCRPASCTGTGCSCQIFRRVSPVPDDWDGKYEHVGDGDIEHQRESGYRYMCWCVKKP